MDRWKHDHDFPFPVHLFAAAKQFNRCAPYQLAHRKRTTGSRFIKADSEQGQFWVDGFRIIALITVTLSGITRHKLLFIEESCFVR